MINRHFENFREMHYGDAPLLLPNAWDAASAALLEKLGVKAITTTSAAVSWTCGYSDDRSFPVEKLLNTIGQIMSVTECPISVDIESGYSDSPEEVASLVSKLMKLGVVGINLEDGEKPSELLVKKISAIRKLNDGDKLFINARTDVLLRRLTISERSLEVLIARLQQYLSAGADCGFIPGLVSAEDALVLAKNVDMPLNVLVMNQSIDINRFFDAGISRFTMGPTAFFAAYDRLIQVSQAFMQGDLTKIFPTTLNYEHVNGLFAANN